MTTLISVLGVLGLCRVRFANSTQAEAPESLVWRQCVLGVLGFFVRARMRVISQPCITARKKLYARTEIPNKPNTLNTLFINTLISLVLKCVGFVLGSLNTCWVEDCGVSHS